MRKILLVLTLITAGTIVQAQSYGAIIKRLDRLGSENSGKDYDEFILEGKKFITVKDSTDHSEKHILEFRPNNQVTMIEIIEDKSTKQEFKRPGNRANCNVKKCISRTQKHFSKTI